MASTEIRRDVSQAERDKMDPAHFAGRDQSYPINEPGDVAAAAASIGRAGPDNYDTDTLKANIIRIAKARGPAFTAQLPAAWRDQDENGTAGDGGRSMHGLPAQQRALHPPASSGQARSLRAATSGRRG